MSKAIRKVLALSLASLMLFSNLSFLSASSLDIAETRSSNSNEPMVEKSEVQVPETSSAKTTTSKVATSKVENTKNETVFETEDAKELATLEVKDIEEVTAQETDIEENAVVTVAPVDEIALETVAEEESQIKEEVVIPTKPVEETPEVAPVEKEDTEVLTEEEPQIEGVVMPTEPVEETPEVAPVEKEDTEVLTEEEPQIEEVVMPTEPVEETPEVAPVEKEDTEVLTEQEPQIEEVVMPTEPVEEEPEVAPEGDETTEPTDDVEVQSEEEIAVPTTPVQEESDITPEGENKEPSKEVIELPTEPVESEPEDTTEMVEKEPVVEEEQKAENMNQGFGFEGPEMFTESYKADESGEEGLAPKQESSEENTEVAPVEDKITEATDEVEPQTKEELTVPAEPVEEPKSEDLMEDDSQTDKSEIVMPDAEETTSGENQAYDEELAEEPEDTCEPEVEVPATEEGASTPCPGLEYAPEDLYASSGPIYVEVDEEHYYEPEDGQWTESTKVDSDITVTFKGPYWYVSCAKFECDLSMCEGFGGAESQYISRRGGSEVTVTAPQAKDGFVFVGWKKVENEREGYIEVYKAVYKEEANTELPMLELNEEVELDDLFVSSKAIHVTDCDHNQPEEGNYTTMVSDAKDRKIKVKYQACNGIVTATKFKCELPIFGGSKEVIETYRGGVEISKEAPEEVDGYVFVKWEKRDPERIPNTTKSSWEVYEAVYVPKAEAKTDANVATNLFQEPAVSVADVAEITDDQAMADTSKLASASDEAECKCKEKGHQWDKTEGKERTCTCPHCKKNASEGSENKVWWDCFSSEDQGEEDKTPRAGAIWWVNFECDLNHCVGFDGYLGVQKTDKVSEGRRASTDKYEMKAPTAKPGFKFKGWYIGEQCLGTSETLNVCWKLMDRTIEARYEEANH